MWRCIIAVCTMALLVACSSVNGRGSRSNHDVPRAQAGEHQTQSGGDVPACFRPRTTVMLGDRQRVVRRSNRKPMRVAVPVGSRLVFRSFGACARVVNTNPQNTRMRTTGTTYRTALRTTTFEAARRGRVRVVVAMPMCAQMDRSSGSACVGGIVLLGTVLVNVETRAPQS
jgi:hypothetical protein